MMAHDSFDYRPDPVIGRLLREHLASDGDAAFVARVREAARAMGGRGPRYPFQVPGARRSATSWPRW